MIKNTLNMTRALEALAAKTDYAFKVYQGVGVPYIASLDCVMYRTHKGLTQYTAGHGTTPEKAVESMFDTFTSAKCVVTYQNQTRSYWSWNGESWDAIPEPV